METNYDALIKPDLRVLKREHGLRGYSKLRKVELIAFLQNTLLPMPSPRPPSKPIPVPRPPLKIIPALKPPSPQSVKLQPKRTRPPNPIRSPPPPPEDPLNPYKLGRAFKGVEFIGVSESMEGIGWTWKAFLKKLEGVSLT